MNLGGARRHRKVLRGNIHGITKPAIRRLANYGEVNRMSGLIYEEIRGILTFFLRSFIHDTICYTEHARRKTVMECDVIYALNKTRSNIKKYYDKNKGVLDVHKGGRKTSKRVGETIGETPQSKVKKSIVIELAKSLIESRKKESSLYSIINKYDTALGEDKLHDILLAFERKGNRFKNENLLAAYLEKCTQGNGRITDTIPFIEAGTPGYI
ncbi:MAG: hypothetical protein IH795_08895 [Bacteroidetes bacterium]|nr:hypothetical protein [Bacteroidota bacterium]